MLVLINHDEFRRWDPCTQEIFSMQCEEEVKEESPYKPEISATTLGGHLEFEYEQNTQQLGATGFKTFWQLVHV